MDFVIETIELRDLNQGLVTLSMHTRGKAMIEMKKSHMVSNKIEVVFTPQFGFGESIEAYRSYLNTIGWTLLSKFAVKIITASNVEGTGS
jgi:hypothetical protein